MLPPSRMEVLLQLMYSAMGLPMLMFKLRLDYLGQLQHSLQLCESCQMPSFALISKKNAQPRHSTMDIKNIQVGIFSGISVVMLMLCGQAQLPAATNRSHG